MIYYSKL